MNRKEAKAQIQPNPQPAAKTRKPGKGGAPAYGAGKHFRDDKVRDDKAGPDDLERNPGIHSSPGTFASGEEGTDEHDETTGVTPRAR